MNKKNETNKIKQTYIKPQLEQVQLIAEEAVLVACKSTLVGGPQ